MKKKWLFLLSVLAALTLFLTGCRQQSSGDKSKIKIVTSTNIYSDISMQIVGKYGTAIAMLKSPSVDPHDFEPTTQDAKSVAQADLLVANGSGYDSWMQRLAKGNNKKQVISVAQDVMGFSKTSNPHIWYDLKMPVKYVDYLTKKLTKIQPRHKAYFEKNAKLYLKKVARLQKQADQIKPKSDKPVFVSEPVFDYALKATGFKVGDKSFEAAAEEETDPTPESIKTMKKAITSRQIAFFVNNVQVSSSTVNNFVSLAKKHDVPVLEVRETMPSHISYLNWMSQSYKRLAAISQK